MKIQGIEGMSSDQLRFELPGVSAFGYLERYETQSQHLPGGVSGRHVPNRLVCRSL